MSLKEGPGAHFGGLSALVGSTHFGALPDAGCILG